MIASIMLYQFAISLWEQIEVEVDVVEPQLVVAGMEPLEFTSIFPTWTPRPDVTAIQEKVRPQQSYFFSMAIYYLLFHCLIISCRTLHVGHLRVNF